MNAGSSDPEAEVCPKPPPSRRRWPRRWRRLFSLSRAAATGRSRMTTDQQLWTLIVACALVMIPFGAMLGTLCAAPPCRALAALATCAAPVRLRAPRGLSPQVAPASPFAWADLRGWNLYFLSKVVLAWMGALDLKILPNLLFLGAAGSTALALGTHRAYCRCGTGGRGAVLPGHLVAAVPAPVGATWRTGLLGGLLARAGPALHQLADGGGTGDAGAGLRTAQAVAAHHHSERAGHAWPGCDGDTDAGGLELGAGTATAATTSVAGTSGGGLPPANNETLNAWLAGFYQQQASLKTSFRHRAARAVRRHHPQHLLAGMERSG